MVQAQLLRFIALLSLNDTSNIPQPKNVTNCTLLFSPSTTSLMTKKAGDYIYSCNDNEMLRYVGIGFPKQSGMRATYHLLSTSLAITTRHTDTRYNFWTPEPDDDSDTQQQQIVSKPSDPPGTVRSITSFFNEPLLYNITSIPLSTTFSFSVTSNNKEKNGDALTLFVKKHQLTLKKREGNSVKILYSITVPEIFKDMIDVQLQLNPRNFSIHCCNASTIKQQQQQQQRQQQQQQQQPHDIDFRKWNKSTFASFNIFFHFFGF